MPAPNKAAFDSCSLWSWANWRSAEAACCASCPGLPPRLGFDCGLGPLLKIEARGLGNLNFGFGFTPAGETVGQEHRSQEQGRGRDPDLGNHAGGHHTTRRDGNLFPYAHDA